MTTFGCICSWCGWPYLSTTWTDRFHCPYCETGHVREAAQEEQAA